MRLNHLDYENIVAVLNEMFVESLLKVDLLFKNESRIEFGG